MSVREAALAARGAGAALGALSADGRRALLEDLAAALERPATRAAVLAANAADLGRARSETGPDAAPAAAIKRLVLDERKIDGLCDGLRQLAAMPELVGAVELRRELDEGLVLERVACPLGLIGVVFEARPDALIQIAGLCLKSGNAALLKGGREAAASNRALVEAVHEVLARHGVPAAAVTLLEARADVDALLSLDGLVEVVVARGSNDFIRHVRGKTRIPVMGHDQGLCHLYLHRAADPDMAARIAVDAKCTYPAACNSIETMLWDAEAGRALDAAVTELRAAGVELRGCPETRARHPEMAPASDSDWDTEHGAPVLGVRRVRDLDDALAHIQAHGSRHTEAIVTGDRAAAERFLGLVDAAGVFWNASTRFADGYRYGLGAELGISTDKLHARGPVGVDGLLTYRWILRGSGHLTAAYGPGKRRLTHRNL